MKSFLLNRIHGTLRAKYLKRFSKWNESNKANRINSKQQYVSFMSY